MFLRLPLKTHESFHYQLMNAFSTIMVPTFETPFTDPAPSIPASINRILNPVPSNRFPITAKNNMIHGKRPISVQLSVVTKKWTFSRKVSIFSTFREN